MKDQHIEGFSEVIIRNISHFDVSVIKKLILVHKHVLGEEKGYFIIPHKLCTLIHSRDFSQYFEEVWFNQRVDQPLLVVVDLC